MLRRQLFGDIAGRWQVKEVTGDIHPGSMAAASVVEGQSGNQKLYLFGGDSGIGRFTNALSTLSTSGKFQRLHPTGEVPSERREHRGFAFEGKVHFIGGFTRQLDRLRQEDFMEKSELSRYYFTNDIYRLDPRDISFTRVSTSGARLPPRSGFGIALLDQRLFVHGGINNQPLNDFFVLDLKSLEWTEILETGLSTPLSNQTLTRATDTEIMLVGGNRKISDTESKISNKVKIYDVGKSEWRDEAPLPTEFGGADGGLLLHETVEMRCGSSVCLLSLGGFVDKKQGSAHPSHIAVFEIVS